MFKKFFEFFPTPRFLKFSYVGLNIGAESLHYAELISTGDSFRLGRYGTESFELGESITSNESLKTVLKKLRKEKSIQYVKVSLPEEETYLFTTEVFGDSEQEIRDMIEFHLEENVPILGQDALFDFYILPHTQDKKIAVVSVVSREVVDRYIHLLSDCGMVAISFLVESGAISRVVVPQGEMGTHMLVCLSREKTILAVVDRGFVQFSSTSSFGGGSLTLALQKQFGLEAEEARNLKYTSGLFKGDSDDEELSFTLTNALSVLRDEIQRVSVYWLKQPQSENKAIEKIILCGKDAAIPGFADYLATTLKIPISVSNIWVNISYYNKVVPQISFDKSLSYATALGLVLSTKM